MKHALIDLGSNSIRLTVYEVNGSFKIVFKEKIMAGLAGYVKDGLLTREGIECACESLVDLIEKVETLGISQLHVFATASLRNVRNSEEVVQELNARTALSIEVISGLTEARLGFKGVSCDTKVDEGLFVDVGGASTEVVLFSEAETQMAVSVPVGSLELYRDYVKGILPGEKTQQRIVKAIREAYEEAVPAGLPKQRHMVCTGGTARAALLLCKKMNGAEKGKRTVSSAEVLEFCDMLCRCSTKAKDLVLRYRPERIHTIVPGLLILCFLIENFGVQEISVSRHGVREGYLLEKVLQVK